MIRMIRGSYSLRGEDGLTRLVEKVDGPFEIPDRADISGADEEKRLVEAGVAEYVGGKPRKEEKPSEETPDEDTLDDIPEDNPDDEPKAKKKPTSKRR